jgi:hypothetical protein
MLRVYTRYQEKVNSLWITPNPYSMIYTLPWVTPGTPINSVTVTVINSSNWDKREFSIWVCKQLCEGLHLRFDYNQSRTIPGITVATLYDADNTSQVQLKWVPSCLRIVSSQGQWRVNRNVPQEMYTDTLYMILSSWNSIPLVSTFRCTWVNSEMSYIVKTPPEYSYTQ